MTHATSPNESRRRADARCAATVIDLLLSFPCLLAASPVIRLSDAAGLPWWGGFLLGMVAWIGASLCLFASFEASPLRGTPGKIACGLIVSALDGKRLGFGLALRRNLAKYALLLPGFVVLMRAGWQPSAALHDRSIGTMVVLRQEGSAE